MRTYTSNILLVVLAASITFHGLASARQVGGKQNPGVELPGQSPDVHHPLRRPSEGSPRTSIGPYLDVPFVVVHPNDAPHPYFAMRAGTVVKYVGNRFSTNQPELLWAPWRENGRERLIWQSYEAGKGGLIGLGPGDNITLLDDALYDLDVGALFVKVKKGDFPPAYMLYETLIGETTPASNDLLDAQDPKRFRSFTSVAIDNVTLFEQTVTGDTKYLERAVQILSDDARYESALNGGIGSSVHPLYATSLARSALFAAFKPGVPDELRQQVIGAVTHFYDHYIEKKQVEIAPGIYSWPYKFEWVMNWGIKLSPPWYSPFANAQVLEISATLYRLTKEQRFKDMALRASAFITTEREKGGSLYTINGFRHSGEYVYASPPLPNVRVLDGEFGAAIALYNASQLLGDSDLLRASTNEFASLAMSLEGYLKEDGNLWFASYIEYMPDGYGWAMWAFLQEAAEITKDKRFTGYAHRFKPFVRPVWCKNYGC